MTALESLTQHRDLVDHIIAEISNLSSVEKAAQKCIEALSKGNKILLCGNGGSAADCQHIAAELVGRFKSNRCALPAIALTTDTSAITAIGNDFGFDLIFSRQIEALGKPGDVLIAISTSGRSKNVIEAIQKAKALGMIVIGLTGCESRRMGDYCDYLVSIPSSNTARIQECHILMGHILCEMIEDNYTGLNS